MPYLTPNQARLRDDIRGLIEGEVRCDSIVSQLYSTDASILQCRPQAVVWPRGTDDVIACVRYAAEKGLTIHARGFGTGTAGESLGSGIVLDFTRSMRRILSLEHESVLVQPGMIRGRLNEVLQKSQHRCFGPVSGFSPATTIGSILARNGAGPNWLRYGKASDHLLEMKVVLANGEILTLDRNQLPQAVKTISEGMIAKGTHSDKGKRVSKGIALARGIVLGKEHEYADEVYRVLNTPEYVPKYVQSPEQRPLEVNRAGYHYHDILQGPEQEHVDLARLFAGSEGTLGLIVEARLRTVSLPQRKAAMVLFFDSIEKAARAATLIFPFRPVLCELVDRRRLNMVLDETPRFQQFLPVSAEAVLLVELDAGTLAEPDEPGEIRTRLEELISTVREREGLAAEALRLQTSEDFALFDEFLHCAELVLFHMRRSIQPLPLFNDLAVPVPQVQPFLVDLLNLLKRHEVTASISGHIGQGQLRVYPIVDLARPDLAPTLQRLADKVYGLVLDYKGTISSEGGTGILKAQYLAAQFPDEIPLFQAIKEIFDPHQMFHPGRLFPKPFDWTERLRKGLAHRGMDPSDRSAARSEDGVWASDFRQFPKMEHPLKSGHMFTWPRRPFHAEQDAEPEKGLSNQLELQLKWDPQSLFESTYLCNGCGDCLQRGPIRRMCPLFRKCCSEESSPRSKANLLRGILEGEIELNMLTTEDAKEIADYCIHCQMCSFECPAEVNVSHLAFRCKSAFVSAHGLALEDLFFSRIDTILRCLAMFSWPINGVLTNRACRWVLEKTLQIPQGRPFPKMAKVTFLSRSQWSTWLAKPPSPNSIKVALFIDTYVNHFDTKLADLAVKILEHNEIGVHVPPRQRTSGLTAFAAGSMERAEHLARHNSLILADLIRQGYQVVTLEPASASCITKDYRCVVDDMDTALVTSHVVDYCDFILQLYRQGILKLDFKPIRTVVGYHAPCRSIACTTQRVDAPTPAEELLRMIPELEVRRIEQGCCGMAGMYGLKKKNHQRSLQIGLPLFRELRSPAIEIGVTDCSSCRMQMEHGTKKVIVHPIRLLAASYGLTSDFRG